MSRRDEEGRAGIEELLRISEEEEARALRAELIHLLQSEEYRDEIASVIQKPLETVVAKALTSPHFVESVQDQLVDALTPMMRETAIEAAREAFRNLDISMPEDTRTKIRTRALQTVETTFTEALKSGAADQLPALGNEVRKLVKSKTEEAVKSGTREAASSLGSEWIQPITNAVAVAVEAAIRRTIEAKADGADARIVITPATPPAAQTEPATPPAHSQNRTPKPGIVAKFMALPGAEKGLIALVIVAGLLWVANRSTSQSKDPELSEKPTIVATSTTRTALTTSQERPEPPPPTPLYLDYQAAFREQTKNLPRAATLGGETLVCIDRSIATATTGTAISFVTLRGQLGGCPGLNDDAPAQKASAVVATLQAQFARVLQECVNAKKAITVDGKKGPGTNTAMKDYISCKDPEDMPSELKTLADYVAVSLVILRERGRL